MAEDVQLAREFFEDFLWPTTVTCQTGEFVESYEIVQPLLPPHASFTMGMIAQHPELAAEFDEFVRRSETLFVMTGRGFDFFGLEGMVTALAAQEGAEDEGSISRALKWAFSVLIAKIFLNRETVEKDVPIANLLVIDAENGKKRLVIADPTLTNTNSERLEGRIFGYCCNFLNRRYMKRCAQKDVLSDSKS